MSKTWICRYGHVIYKEDGCVHMALSQMTQYATLDIHDSRGNLMDRFTADAMGSLTLSARFDRELLSDGFVLQAEPGNVFLVAEIHKED